MAKPLVYLAGPIAGCDHNEANDWRDYVAGKLHLAGIIGVSPLRCEPLIGDRYKLQHSDPRFGTARAIAAKNLFDVRRCDMVFAFMPNELVSRQISLGTTVELAWGFSYHKPTILVTTNELLRSHPVVQACVSWSLSNLEEGIDVCLGVLRIYGE